MGEFLDAPPNDALLFPCPSTQPISSFEEVEVVMSDGGCVLLEERIIFHPLKVSSIDPIRRCKQRRADAQCVERRVGYQKSYVCSLVTISYVTTLTLINRRGRQIKIEVNTLHVSKLFSILRSEDRNTVSERNFVPLSRKKVGEERGRR